MANCTAAQVRLIIETEMEDADITSLITLADAEITARGLDSLNSTLKQNISMYFTADLVSSRDPKNVNAGPISAQSPNSQTWRQKAEALIRKVSSPPIYVKNDPLPNE